MTPAKEVPTMIGGVCCPACNGSGRVASSQYASIYERLYSIKGAQPPKDPPLKLRFA